MIRSRFLIALAITALVLLVVSVCALRAELATASERAQCSEDDPCWVWSKMGNRKRGIVTLHGTPMVVGPCKFSRLWRSGDIRHVVTVDGVRYATLEKLRGDFWAIEHGCN